MPQSVLGDTSMPTTINRHPRTYAAALVAVAFIATLAVLASLLVAVTGSGTASAETPAERCARETAAYNQAWATSWAGANPGQQPSDAPPPPVPYVCVQPQDPTTTSPTPTTAPGLPEADDTGSGPNAGAHAPTDIPAAGSEPIVSAPGQQNRVTELQTVPELPVSPQADGASPTPPGNLPPAQGIGWKCTILNPAACLDGDLLNPTIYDKTWTLTPEESLQLWEGSMDAAGYGVPLICGRFLGAVGAAGCTLIMRGVSELGKPESDEYFEITAGVRVRGPFFSVRKLKLDDGEATKAPDAPSPTTPSTQTPTTTSTPVWTPPQTTPQWTPTQDAPNEQTDIPAPEPPPTTTPKAPEKPPQMIDCSAPNPPSKCNLV